MKKKARRLKYFYALSNDNTVVEKEDLDKYDIPQKIKDEMLKWSTIIKSPYSDSFYDHPVSLIHGKPDGLLRVSNHWNFKSIQDNKLHCVTNKDVINDTYVSLAKYNSTNKIYDILISEISDKYLRKLDKRKSILKYLTDPETIYKKKQFKDRVLKKEISAKLLYDEEEYSGILRKWTSSEIQIEDTNGNIIFNKSDMHNKRRKPNTSIISNLLLTDNEGNTIEDPYKRYKGID